MEPDEDSNAQWLYHRCVTARVKMETPLNPLELSMKVLQFMKTTDEDAEGVDQLELFSFLKKRGKAKQSDISFVYDLEERALDLRDDGDLSEDALKKVAASIGEGASSIGIGDGACVEGNQGGVAVAGASKTTSLIQTSVDIETSSTQQTAPKRQDENVTKYDGVKQHINSDELHCFQLRTRVLGLNMPTFQKLWGHLQAAGWKYISGKYHIPKGRKNKLSLQYTTEDKAKRIFNHFNLDNCDKSHYGGEESSDEEEGPKIFDGPNELVDYLDEYCMPDYRATTAEIQAQQKEMPAKSKAYKRRCKRLRFELLEVVYLDRLRKENTEEQEEAKKIEVTKEVNAKKEVKEEAKKEVNGEPHLPSKYGHNHRPCEVCFKGGSPDYPRVACRCCGLVVHTNCYGLLDHDEEESNRRIAAKQRVDEKGLFTCDVCENSLDGGTAKKKWWHAHQSSGWRKHEDPNAKCPLCEGKNIAGGMVHIVVGEGEGTNGRKKRKRSSRRSEEAPSETWVHLFCLNSLKKTSPGTVRSSESAVNHIHDALDKAAKVLKETESMKERTVRCEGRGCATRKGNLLQCKGKCGRMFHSLCLQIDCMDAVDWDEKKEHLCLHCRGLMSASPDKTIEPIAAKSENEKIEIHIGNPSKTASSRQETATNEVDQYFDRKSRKRPMKLEGARDGLTIPPQQECAIEVEALHHHSNMDQGFDEFEGQYQQQFGEWSFSLATNQSILLYGIGSKTKVLASFGQHLSSEGDVVSLNGFDPSIDLNQFFACINQLFFGDSGQTQMNTQHPALKNNIPVKDYKGLPRKAASIAKKFASTRTRPLFLLIHNIDGAGLRNCFAQDAIATLTADSKKDGLPLIRIAASVDNVHASMVLWSPQVEHKFDWAWKKVDTYRPYFEEVNHLPQAEASKKVTKSTGKRKHGAGAEALKVLEYLAPRIKEVLQLLATLQVGNAHHPIPYTMLRQECTKKMLTGSDANLRSFLKELADHNMVVSEKGDDGIEQMFVPSTIPMHEILSFKPY